MIGQFKHLAVLALLGVSTYADVANNDGQKPITEYNTSPLSRSKVNELRLSALTPSTMDASAQLRKQTPAEIANVMISIETEATTAEYALGNARYYRDQVENQIQSLSHDTSEFYERYEYDDSEDSGRSRRRRGGGPPPSSGVGTRATATAIVGVKFNELDALERFVKSIEDQETHTVSVTRIQWKLTSETQKKVMSELRRDALKELRGVGANYQDVFGVVIASMEDYKECGNRNMFMYEEDDEFRSTMYDWKTIRNFFNAPGEEPKVGQVTTFLDVSCRFVAAKCSREDAEIGDRVKYVKFDYDSPAMAAARAASDAEVDPAKAAAMAAAAA